MSLINETLGGVTVGNPVQFRNLVMYPLLGTVAKPAAYLTLEEALGAGKCKITEISDAGSVPELFFENLSPDKVLLLDGEELMGAKQNRVLNLSILIGGQIKIKIPVSCVEHGRWRHQSAQFHSPERVMYSRGRAAKMSSVSASIRDRGTRHSDQGEVWDLIAQKSARLNAHSDTGASEAIYEKHRASTQEYTQAIQPQPGQLGALFAINGEVVGMDLFDAAPTFNKVFGKLLTSYAIDAIDVDQEVTDAPPKGIVEQFLKHITAAKIESFNAVGEGHDIRLESAKVVGAGLQDGDRLVHLAAFQAAQVNGRRRFSRV